MAATLANGCGGSRAASADHLGNPHSVNPTSSAATVLVEQARAAVLRYFNADETEYACIFTPNATGALRLVGEAYPFTPRGRFLATLDNHNSVNGIREFARAKGAAFIPSCAATFHSESDDEIFRQIAAHARDEHGIDEVPSEVIDQIRAGITEHRAGAQ